MTDSQYPQPAPAHTPGPWAVSELDARGETSEFHIFIEPGVAVIERKVAGSDQCDMPDARLIAAAPELLAALQGFMATDLNFGTASIAMLEHLAAAETRSARLARPVLAARRAIAKALGVQA